MNETPGQLSEKLMEQSDEYGHISDLLGAILTSKPDKWTEIRTHCTSDTQAERLYEATEDGVKETVYRLKLRSLDKSMSAIKTRLRILEGEARNLY